MSSEENYESLLHYVNDNNGEHGVIKAKPNNRRRNIILLLSGLLGLCCVIYVVSPTTST